MNKQPKNTTKKTKQKTCPSAGVGAGKMTEVVSEEHKL